MYSDYPVTTSQLLSVRDRLKTFSNWPSDSGLQPETLANAGFYYIPSRNQPKDQVECFWCRLPCARWDKEDDPWYRHAHADIECKFVIDTKGRTFVDGAIRGPARPQFSTLNSRLATFTHWPKRHHLKPSRLAKQGFYYNSSVKKEIPDAVFCYECDVGLPGWVEGDDPEFRHAQASPKCKFVVSNSKKDFVKKACKDPAKPQFSTLESRLASFTSWPLGQPHAPEDLAMAGFFFNPLACEPELVCFQCGLIVGQWGEADDDPWYRHAIFNSDCPFVLQHKGKAFMDEARVGPLKPKFASLESRLATFPGSSSQSFDTFAEAGIFRCTTARKSELYMCFHCGMGVQFLDPRVDPWYTHALLSPKCHFLLFTKGKAFVDKAEGGPQSPHVSTVKSRLDTLKNWPENYAIKPKELAVAGFYNCSFDDDKIEKIVCFHCGLIVELMETYSDPWLVHAKGVENKPHCEYLLSVKSESWVQKMQSKPLRTEFSTLKSRIATFKNWPLQDDPLKPTDLAEAGFFHPPLAKFVTSAACFHCGEGSMIWYSGDDPWYRHARINPDCRFLMSNKKKNYLNNARLGPAVPQFSTLESRLATYPSQCQRAMDEAEAGCFCMSSPDGDVSICFQCEMGFKFGDQDPWLEHAVTVPNCKFLLDKKGRAFVDMCRANN